MASPAFFKVTDLKRAIKAARDLGMTVTGYDINPDGGISVRTAEANDNSADAAVDAWKRGRRAQR